MGRDESSSTIVAYNSELVSLDESGNKNDNIVSENAKNVSIPSPSSSPSEAAESVSLQESGSKNKNIVSQDPENVSIPSPSEAAKLLSLHESASKNENINSEKAESVSIPSPSEATNLILLGKSGNTNENIVLENTETEPIPSPSEIDPSQVLFLSPDKLETFEPIKEEKETVSVSVSVSVAKSAEISPSKSAKKLVMNKSDIDTAAPIKSVKAAVSKFGGIVDWKAHKVQAVEKHKILQEELNRANEDIPMYKTQSQSAEEAKTLVLKELEGTKRLIEELKLSLERAQTEQQQTKLDAELAKLQTEEMEKGIKEDASVAARAQLEVARARHETAVTELKSLTRELEQIRKDYESLVAEKDLAVQKAVEAQADNLKTEKTVEELTIELISKKKLLELAHADHLEAEEKKVEDSITREQDKLNWENKLKQAEEELERLKREIILSRDLKSKLDTSSSLLRDLRAELGAYMESKIKEDKEKTNEKTHLDILEAVEQANNELLEVRANIKKATNEVNILNIAATSINLVLEEEKSALKNMKQPEGIASEALSFLEWEVDKIKSEILATREKEKVIRERLVNVRNELQDASREADVANSTAEIAREELRKATEEADLAKVKAGSINSTLLTTTKDIEVAKVSEKLALSAINAMRKSTETEDVSRGVVLSLEEYYGLNKRAHEVEEKAKTMVANAISQIGVAKELETKSLKKLKDLENKIISQKEEMEKAISKAEYSEKGKLGAEQELRKWRASHEERRKKGENIENQINVTSKSDSQNIAKSVHQRTDSNECLSGTNMEMNTSSEVKTMKKKKKSIFPRFFMFLGRKKAQHAAKST